LDWKLQSDRQLYLDDHVLQYFETDDPELYKTKVRYIEDHDIEGMELTFSEEEYIPGTQGNPGTVKVGGPWHSI